MTDREDEMQIDDTAAGDVRRKGRGFKSSDASSMETGSFASILESGAGEFIAKDGATAVRSIEGWIVLVTNIHEEASEEDIVDAFAEFGEIRNCHLNLDRRTGYVKGYALVEYTTPEEAKNAIEKMNSKKILDQLVECDYAFVRPKGRPRRERSASPQQRPLEERMS
ncbi:RNA-binding protein 8A [Neolecta irregularis DAH-3]|uniref:RNA-binding protein 8A n=1 Tax=Neolecta irregularis (strain DAH-3) TaxID=1198029 RepID=A0A1U7LSK3_NEOID|nr:RNA-binding protein 8A [Neolecta irregularis DAH-3]|eukprot:OLL25656.1 RNA-binding protein 8A [Neolecta irregularis DAH-3]